MKAGLIGAGAMGAVLLSKILEKHYPVSVYDVDEGRCAAAEAAGARKALSPREVAASADIVHVFVGNDQQVLDAVLGPNGVSAAIKPGQIVLIHSTVLPQTTRTIAARLPNATILDAPITAVPKRVREGKGIALMGGPPEAIERVRPYLNSLTLEARNFGPLGSGNAAELAKNFANAAERLALINAVELAQAAGLDARQFLEMVQAATSDSAVQRWSHVFDFEGAKAKPRRVTNLFDKDVGLAAELAKSFSVDGPYMRGADAETTAIVRKWRA